MEVRLTRGTFVAEKVITVSIEKGSRVRQAVSVNVGWGRRVLTV